MELKERQREIFDLICEHKKMTVSQLAHKLYVTEMTIRRDLSEMERRGYLKRYRGGAMALPRNDGFPLPQRLLLDEDEKRQLGKMAAAYLRDHICVFIDSSSTAQFLIPHIKKFQDIQVVTNSVSALAAASKLNIPCFMLGGEYCEHDMCCIGPLAELNAGKFHVDVAFVSTLGISKDGCITDSSLAITAVKERIIENARHTVFMFEASKLGKTGFYTLAHRDDEHVTVLCSQEVKSEE